PVRAVPRSGGSADRRVRDDAAPHAVDGRLGRTVYVGPFVPGDIGDLTEQVDHLLAPAYEVARCQVALLQYGVQPGAGRPAVRRLAEPEVRLALERHPVVALQLLQLAPQPHHGRERVADRAGR